MRLVLLLIVLSVVPVFSFAQDSALRSRAVSLMERAYAVSVPPNLPNLERVITFRVFDPKAPAREGSFTRVVIQGAGRRDDIHFGDYHVVNAFSDGGARLATTRTGGVTPPEVVTVMRLTPIWLGRFDRSDIVRAIIDKELGGRLLHCIEFDTIVGESRQDNEICVDGANGTLASARIGITLVENSNFFPFAGTLQPGKIVYSENGTQMTMRWCRVRIARTWKSKRSR